MLGEQMKGLKTSDGILESGVLKIFEECVTMTVIINYD